MTAPVVTSPTIASLADARRVLAEAGAMSLVPAAGLPSLVGGVAGGPVRGSWWSHARGRLIFEIATGLEEDADVLVAKLVEGKVAFVHRRLWPALVRCAARFPAERLARTRERHTPEGKHLREDVSFPAWVPADVLAAAATLSDADALHALGAGVT